MAHYLHLHEMPKEGYSREAEGAGRGSKDSPKEVKASKVLLDGDAAFEILQAVEKLQVDLITIATHGHTGWRHLVFGSVAEKVVRMSKVPVLTVRGEPLANQ